MVLLIRYFHRTSSPTTYTGLHTNWFASESHTDDIDLDNRDDYTYFFNLCAPIINVPSVLTSRVEYFNGDIAVLQRVENDINKPTDDDDPLDSTDGYVLGRRSTSPGLTRLMDGDLRYTFGAAETSIIVNGQPYNTSRHCTSRNTTLLLFCTDVGIVC